MPQNDGTLITAAIRPNDSLDKIATTYANEGNGGLHGYATLAERDAIMVERRGWGMLCTVYDDGAYNGTYQLTYNLHSALLNDNSNWQLFNSGGFAVGMSITYWGTTPPPGWMPCEGQSLIPAYYPLLFAAIGVQYGGDGVLNFMLPDCRKRILIHPLAGDPNFGTVGQKSGEETVELLMPNMPKHRHNFKYFPKDGNGAGDVVAGIEDTPNTAANNPVQFEGGTPLLAEGHSVPHNNMPPNIVAPQIIKVN